MQEPRNLGGIRSLGNVNNETIIELTTNLGKEYLKIPYKVKQLMDGKNRYEYLMGVRQFCSARNINCKKYFGFVHMSCY